MSGIDRERSAAGPLFQTHAPGTWDEVEGHAKEKAMLQSFATTGRWRNLLIVGDPGIGKTTLAELYVRRLVCGSANGPDPCGHCAACVGGLDLPYALGPAVLRVSGTNGDPLQVMGLIGDDIGYCKAIIIDEADRLLSTAQRLIGLIDRYKEVTVILTAISDQMFRKYGNGQLNSRCQVLQLKPLEEAEICALLDRVHRAVTGKLLPDQALQHVLESLASRGVEGRARDALQELEAYHAAT